MSSGVTVPAVGILGTTAVVTWEQDSAPGVENILSDTFLTSPDRPVANGVAAKVADSWASLSPTMALVPTTTGSLQIAFSAIHTTSSSDPLIGLISETHNADGSWSAPAVIASGEAGASTGVLGPAGPVFASNVAGTISILANPNSPASGVVANLQAPLPAGSDGYVPTLALDSMGRLWAAWYSSGTGGGIYVQQLDPASGQPLSPAVEAPDSSDIYNNGVNGIALSCAVSCRVVYGDEPSGSQTDAIVSWWPGDAAKSMLVNLAGTGQNAGRVLAARYRSDGKLWVVWWNGKTYSYMLGDATGAGGVVQDAGVPGPLGGAYGLTIAPVGNDLLMAVVFNYVAGVNTDGVFVNTVAPPAPLVTLPVSRQQTLQAGPGKSFRIQVQFRVPAVCKLSCTARAELRTRHGRQVYAVSPTSPLSGDGKIVLGRRASVKLPGGKKVRFYLTISKAELLRSPFRTVGGNRVANTRLRVWLTGPKGQELAVRDGRIAVSIARIKSGALPGLSGIL